MEIKDRKRVTPSVSNTRTISAAIEFNTRLPAAWLPISHVLMQSKAKKDNFTCWEQNLDVSAVDTWLTWTSYSISGGGNLHRDMHGDWKDGSTAARWCGTGLSSDHPTRHSSVGLIVIFHWCRPTTPQKRICCPLCLTCLITPPYLAWNLTIKCRALKLV